MMNRPDQSDPRKSLPVPRPLKPYTIPTLTVFGAVARLTKGYGGGRKDLDGHPRP